MSPLKLTCLSLKASTREVVGKKGEGEAWPHAAVRHLYGFKIAVLLCLHILGESLLSERVVQEVS